MVLPEQINDGEHPATESAQQSLMIRPKGTRQGWIDRLSLAFYQLTWRTPLHNMKLTGKLPLRLLANPVDHVAGDAARGKAILMGQFHYQGFSQPLHEINYDQLALPPAMVDYIHRFGWLRDLAAVSNRGEGAPIAASILDTWLDANANTVREPAWGLENCSWRLLNMAAWAPYILSSNDLIYRSRVLNHAARTARHLDQSAPRASGRFARLTGWAGVVAASLLLPEGKARRMVGESGLSDAIDETVFADGGVISRSPLQLIELIQLLNQLRECYLVREEKIPTFLSDTIAHNVPALLGLSHSDGGLGAWQGSAHVSSNTIEKIVSATGVRARPHRQALDWGYQRVASGNSVLLLDAGPPPLAKQSAAGCASTLAFEFSHAKQRLIVNCGGAGLVGASIPATLARGLRTTAAHSTLCIDDTNSTSILPGGQLGKGVLEVGLDRRDIDKATRIESSHDGYVRSFGFAHSRLLIVRSDGLELRGEDTLLPQAKSNPRESVPVHIRFHLGPDIELAAGDNGQSVILRLADGSGWLFASGTGEVHIDESIWVDEYGVPHPTQQIIIAKQADKGGLSVGWQLRFLG